MIHTVLPLPVGTALRLFLSPPTGALIWRILRKGADDFTGPDDTGAVTVYEGDEPCVLDTTALQNGVPVFYRPYYWISGAWTDGGATASGTPAASYADVSTDVHSLVRDRLQDGLAEEVSRGTLSNALGYIQVFSAPPQLSDDLRLPVVTVELESEDPAERAIGEDTTGDDFDGVHDFWDQDEGWLARVRLTITGWSLNPDERIALRQALRRLVVGNLPVFAAAGMQLVEFEQRHVDFLNGEFGAPLYQTAGVFTCLAPVIVRSQVGTVADVEISPSTP